MYNYDYQFLRMMKHMGIRNRKEWLDRRSRKLHKRKKTNHSSSLSSQSSQNYLTSKSNIVYGTEYRADAPKIFSFAKMLLKV